MFLFILFYHLCFIENRAHLFCARRLRTTVAD